jgi:protein tyrosine phosphatase (PTP) superfamily phosphohydrolase (DUF442 family)
MIHRFLKVDKDIYRGSSPDIKDVQRLKNEFGIRKIISLDRDTGEKIDRACKLLGIEHVKIYMETKGDVAKLLKYNIRDLLTKGGPVFFHCRYGKDRTGLLAALYEVKYMGVSPEKALEKAKSLGFGIGIPESVSGLYEKMIRACKPINDENKADIVSNEREYVGDNRDTFLDESRQSSFSPYLDHTKQAPADALYNYILDQSPTRQEYEEYREDKKKQDNDKGDQGENVPQVGVYNNDSGVAGFGPSIQSGGFLYD